MHFYIRSTSVQTDTEVLMTKSNVQGQKAVKRSTPAEHAKRVVTALGAGGVVVLVAVMGLTDGGPSDSQQHSPSAEVTNELENISVRDTQYLLDGYSEVPAPDYYSRVNSAPTPNYSRSTPVARSSGSG